MAKDNAPDLISIFGLSTEEAAGLGLASMGDADARPHDLQEPTPYSAPPGSAGVSPVPDICLLSAGAGEQRSECAALPGNARAVASRDDDLAFLAMLEDDVAASSSSMGFEGRRDLMTPPGSAGIVPTSVDQHDAGAPRGNVWQDTPPEKSLPVDNVNPSPSSVSEDDEGEADLAALFGMSAEEAVGFGLAAPATDATSTDAADPDTDEYTPVTNVDTHRTPWDRRRPAGLPSQEHALVVADVMTATAAGGTPAVPGGTPPPTRGEREYPVIRQDGPPVPRTGRAGWAGDSAESPAQSARGGGEGIPATEDVIDPLLLDAFSEESAELLDALHVELENMESNAGDHGALLEIRRIVHTLKGGAKMCLFEHVVTLTHSCENLLDLSADGASPLDTPALRALFSCEPLLRALVQDALMDQCDEGRIDAAIELAAHFDALCISASGEPDGQSDGNPTEKRYSADIAGPPYYAATNIALISEGMDVGTVADSAEDTRAIDARRERQESASSAAVEQPALELDDVAPIISVGAIPDGDAIERATSRLPTSGVGLTNDRTDDLGERATGVAGATGTNEQRGERAVSERGGGRRARASINVDLSKVDAVVAKVTEMAAHRSSYQGMVGQLMETTAEARRGILRLQNLSLGIANECATTQPPAVTVQRAGANDLGLESYSALNTLALQLQEAVADQQALIEKMYDTITNHWSLRATENRVDADLQSALMNIRLIPLSTMRVRLDGVIRQAAQATGKSVRWQLQGGNVAVEKSVFDRLFEPLMHLLRNAVDHGLEESAARRAAGKPETGVIIVAVKGEDSHVVITVSDDGAGIDPHKIAALAVDRGVVGAERAASLSARQKLELIFTPGFSTAASVSHLSGRGVGMDAVREACLRMGGAIDVESRHDGGQDQGTTFTMRLPLSLSVTRGLIVRDGACYMAVPVGQITALHLVSASDIVDTPEGRVARIEGQDLPVYNLPPLPGAAAPAYVQHGEAHVLQLPHEGGSLGLIIEDVLDEEEMLIKPAPPLLRGVKTLLGAHVLPDGTVAPVINLPRLLADLRPAATLRAEKEGCGERGPVALVVDDSMSMRVALTGTLQGVGFTVLTARDGQEALDALKRDGLPALIMLDIEMPRMDGLEALFAIRQLPGAGRLPIFMMTSRGGAKHRRAAEQLGATRYFTKPYRDSELAAAARAACATGA